jgi:hypothetical protein
MAEERPDRLIALRRGLHRQTRRHPTAWVSLGMMCLAGLVILTPCVRRLLGPTRVNPKVSLPSEMAAVVGGIEGCYDSGPPLGGYPWVTGSVALYAARDHGFLKPIAVGTAAANADFVVLAPSRTTSSLRTPARPTRPSQ